MCTFLFIIFIYFFFVFIIYPFPRWTQLQAPGDDSLFAGMGTRFGTPGVKEGSWKRLRRSMCTCATN